MRPIKFLASFIFLLGIADGALAAPTANPFAGTWTDSAHITLMVSDTGDVTGGAYGIPVSGRMKSDGSLTASGASGWGLPDGGTGSGTRASGKLSGVVDQSGHLVGIFTVSVRGKKYTGVFDFVLQE